MTEAEAIVKAITEGDEDFDVKELTPELPVSAKVIQHQGRTYVYGTQAGFGEVNIGVIDPPEPGAEGYSIGYTQKHGILRRPNNRDNIVFPSMEQAISAVYDDWLGKKNITDYVGQHFVESEDDFDVKDVGPPPMPDFEMKQYLPNTPHLFQVYADGKWIGSLNRHQTGPGAWWTVIEATRPDITHRGSFKTSQDACEYLWFNRRQDVEESEEEDFTVKEISTEKPEFYTELIEWKPEEIAEFARQRVTPHMAFNVFYQGQEEKRWLGRIANINGEWVTHGLRELAIHPQPSHFNSAAEVIDWLWDHRAMLPHHKVEEAFEDEEGLGKEMDINLGFYVGARVQILTGQYEGERGTVVGKTSFGAQRQGEYSFWVHLDGHEDDPSSATAYRGEHLALIGDVDYPAGMRVKIVAGEHAGVKGYVTGADRREQIVWVHLDTMGDEWATMRFPITEVVNINESEKAVRQILAEVTDDEEGMKDYGYNPLSMAVQALKEAGFNVTQAERIEDEWFLKFNWAAPTAMTYISGAKRAIEVLKPYIKIGPGHYSADYRGTREEGVASIFVRKRVEEDPNLWRITPPRHQGVEGHFKILYNNMEVGEIYTTPGGAGRVLDEMMALHKIAFFPLQKPDMGWWTWPGNVFGSGPAVAWWRHNRERLPEKDRSAEHFVNKGLLEKPQ